MYKYTYLPVVEYNDLCKAIYERFGRKVDAVDVFGMEVEEGYYDYSLDQNLNCLPDNCAITYTYIKSVLKKDFNLHTKSILIYIY